MSLPGWTRRAVVPGPSVATPKLGEVHPCIIRIMAIYFSPGLVEGGSLPSSSSFFHCA